MENLFAWTYDRSEATDPLLFARIASKEKLHRPVFLWCGVADLQVLSRRNLMMEALLPKNQNNVKANICKVVCLP